MPDLQEFVDAVDLKDMGEGHFERPALAGGRGFVFAGLLSAQMLRAVLLALPDRDVRSLTASYLRAVQPGEPAEVVVTTLHAGGQLATATAAMTQAGRTCAHAQVLLGPLAADVVRHQEGVAPTAAPDDVPEATTGGLAGMPGEWRVVGGIDTHRADQALPAELAAWRRAPGLAATGVPAEVLLAHDVNAALVGTALLPHEGMGMDMAHASLDAVITSSHIVFHDRVDLEDWVLLDHTSTYAGGGWCFGRGTASGADGSLLASFTLEAMLRPMPEGRHL